MNRRMKCYLSIFLYTLFLLESIDGPLTSSSTFITFLYGLNIILLLLILKDKYLKIPLNNEN